MENWNKIVLQPHEPMSRAIEVLNDESSGIILVASENNILIGTITDGDIRRALMSHCLMESMLQEFMCKDPIFAGVENSRSSIIKTMMSHNVLQIPILTKDRKIVGLQIFQDLVKNRKYNNPVFLMAGGIGSRLKPLTDNTPKPLLHVGLKPILETILDQFIACGFHNFYISTHYKAEMIQDYFGDGEQWGVSIHYVHEDKPLGTGGALGLLPKDLPDLPIIMMNGDILTKVDFTKILNYHIKNGGIATIATREYLLKVPYGVINANNNSVTSIIEKPVQKFFINAGIYVLSSDVIKMINGTDYLDMPQFLGSQIKLNQQINSFPIHEYWIDIGHTIEFDRANQEIKDLFNK
jgi:dTDP-glucose pyrophosphorylase